MRPRLIQPPTAAHSRLRTPADLAQVGYALREVGSATRATATAHLHTLGVEPRVVIELGSNEAVKRAVAAGVGVGMLSRSALVSEVAAGHLTVLEMPGPACRRSLYRVRRRDHRLTAAEQAFVAISDAVPTRLAT